MICIVVKCSNNCRSVLAKAKSNEVCRTYCLSHWASFIDTQIDLKILSNLLNHPVSNYPNTTSTFILLYIYGRVHVCTHSHRHTCTQSKAISFCNPNQIFWAPLISFLLHAQNVKLLKNTAYFWGFSSSSLVFKLENHRTPTFDWGWSVCWVAKRIKSYNSLNIQSYYDTSSFAGFLSKGPHKTQTRIFWTFLNWFIIDFFIMAYGFDS